MSKKPVNYLIFLNLDLVAMLTVSTIFAILLLSLSKNEIPCSFFIYIKTKALDKIIEDKNSETELYLEDQTYSYAEIEEQE